jgi:hypothetical protein
MTHADPGGVAAINRWLSEATPPASIQTFLYGVTSSKVPSGSGFFS